MVSGLSASCRFPSRLASSYGILSNLFPWFCLKSVLISSLLLSVVILSQVFLVSILFCFNTSVNTSSHLCPSGVLTSLFPFGLILCQIFSSLSIVSFYLMRFISSLFIMLAHIDASLLIWSHFFLFLSHLSLLSHFNASLLFSTSFCLIFLLTHSVSMLLFFLVCVSLVSSCHLPSCLT